MYYFPLFLLPYTVTSIVGIGPYQDGGGSLNKQSHRLCMFLVWYECHNKFFDFCLELFIFSIALLRECCNLCWSILTYSGYVVFGADHRFNSMKNKFSMDWKFQCCLIVQTLQAHGPPQLIPSRKYNCFFLVH